MVCDIQTYANPFIYRQLFIIIICLCFFADFLIFLTHLSEAKGTLSISSVILYCFCVILVFRSLTSDLISPLPDSAFHFFDNIFIMHNYLINLYVTRYNTYHIFHYYQRSFLFEIYLQLYFENHSVSVPQIVTRACVSKRARSGRSVNKAGYRRGREGSRARAGVNWSQCGTRSRLRLSRA